MSDITGLRGFNKAGTSINLLLAGYGNDVVNLSNGLGYSLNLDSTLKEEMDVFLDRVFLQNYDHRPVSFNGTTWSTTYLGRVMTSKFIKSLRTDARVYLGYAKFTAPQKPLDTSGNDIIFPNRVFVSDLFVANNLTWGMEWGTNGKTSAGSPFFDLAQPLVQDFVASNIKVGDPLVITSGDSTLANTTFTVKNIISPFRLEATENFTVTATSLNYWVGSNWFDVGPDDNDSITGLGENQGNLFVPKLFHAFIYTGTSLRQIPDGLGTSSNRSIIETKTGTYWFHGSDPFLSGIYKYDGSEVTRISRPIDPFIRGMDSNNYTKVVVWREGEELRWFLGNLSNTNRNISQTNSIVTYNYSTGAWDVGPISDIVRASSTFSFGNENKFYIGNDSGEVLKMGTGYSFNGDPIPYNLETKVYYPSGTEIINEFSRIQVIGRATKGVRVKFKLWDMPKEVDDNWISLGELNDDKTELLLPIGHKMSSGIQLKFEGMDTLENDVYIEKFTCFYVPQRTRLL